MNGEIAKCPWVDGGADPKTPTEYSLKFAVKHGAVNGCVGPLPKSWERPVVKVKELACMSFALPD